MMNILLLFLRIFIFPGIAFIFVMSILLAGLDRRFVARMQRRVGPPLLQPWYDYLKCIGKETIIPRKANKNMFLFAPLLGLASVFVTAMFLPVGQWQVFYGTADVVVVLYLLTLASVAIIMGSSASGSPFAGVGLSREMVAMISYELPFVLILLAVGKVAGTGVNNFYGVTFSFSDITRFQYLNGPMITHIALIPAAIAMLFVIPCEVGQQPFDIDEAETEICEGVLAEYSGHPLGRYKMMHYIKMFIMSGFFCALFLNISTGIAALDIVIYIVSCIVVTFVSMSLPHAVCARFRVEQVFKFYWTFVTGLALISLILVWIGL